MNTYYLRGTTGFTPICPVAVGTIALIAGAWGPGWGRANAKLARAGSKG